jgi:hypothetical protein
VSKDQIIDRDLTGGLRTTEVEWYDESEEDKEIVYLCSILHDFGFDQVFHKCVIQ